MTPTERIKQQLKLVRWWALPKDLQETLPQRPIANSVKVLEAAPVEALIAKIVEENRILRAEMEVYAGIEKQLIGDESIAQRALAAADKIWDEQNKGEVK